MNRAVKDIQTIIERHALDLSGLTVLTEAASGPYLYTPIMAAMTGAEKVIALTANSRFAKADDVIAQTMKIAKDLGLQDRIVVEKDKRKIDYSQIDIVTNSGFVRPIDRSVIQQLKETAVVCLMWETWEYRGDEVDLKACKENDILVLGTHESHPDIDLDPYVGMLLLKMLFEMGLSGYKTKIILISSHQFGDRLQEACERYGIEYVWFSDKNTHARPLKELTGFVDQNLDGYDAIILAEMKDDQCFIGEGCLLESRELVKINPDIKIGVIAGNIDLKGLDEVGISYIPKILAPPKYVSYQVYQLGSLPVLELYAAGLKVGQAMARVRKNKQGSVQDAARFAINHSPAMDFPGEMSWL